MIGGQVMDLESEGLKPSAELVERIHRSKTGALITVSVVVGGHLVEGGEDAIARLRTFGEKAGLAFQIVDDVLDVTQDSTQLGKTAGKDTATDKATWPAIFGVEQSLHDAEELIADAFAALEPFGAAADPPTSRFCEDGWEICRRTQLQSCYPCSPKTTSARPCVLVSTRRTRTGSRSAS
jgi:geranylgeranyl diphosphate synthase type II